MKKKMYQQFSDSILSLFELPNENESWYLRFIFFHFISKPLLSRQEKSHWFSAESADLTLIGMRADNSISFYFLDQILSADFLSKISKLFCT